jgi:peptide/nickel transport system substrate-binding protein
MRPVQRRLVASVVFAALLLTACGGGTGASPQGGGGPTRGGTLTMAIYQEPSSLHPYYTTQTVAHLVWQVSIEGLTHVDPDGNYIPWLAKEVPTLKNSGVKMLPSGGMDVTYKLVPGVLWADGKPFTSADVAFTWKMIMSDPKVTSKEGYEKVTSVDTPDPLTAVVHYKEVYAAYATRFTEMFSKAALEGLADISKSEFTRKPLGTGPFKITEFVSGDHITAERNPNYRVKDKPYLDKIIFRSVPSREAAIAQVKAGEVDAMWDLLEAQVPDLERNPDLKLSIVQGAYVERLDFNLKKPGNPADDQVSHPVLGDVNVRRALLLATPKKTIIEKLLYNKVKPGASLLSAGWAVPKDLKQEEYDPAKAKQLLDQAGWAPGSDGIRTKGGVRAQLRITTTSGNKTREQVEQIIADEWQRVGVKLSIENVPSSVLFGNWTAGAPRRRGNYDINMYASDSEIDPQATLSLKFNSKNIPRTQNNGAGQNFTRFADPEVDRLLDQAGSSVDQEQRKKLYAQILKKVNDNVTNVWLYNRANIDAFRANVGGYKGNPWDNITWSIEDWYKR